MTNKERVNKLVAYLDEAVAYLKEEIKCNRKNMIACDTDRIISLAEQIKTEEEN